MTDVVTALRKSAQIDPDGTAMLIRLAAHEAMQAEATDLMPTLAVQFIPEAREAVAKAKAALVRTYVSKATSGHYPSSEHLRTAAYISAMEDWLDDVSKAGSWEQWNTSRGAERRQVARDTAGRFARVGSATRRKPVVGVRESSLQYGRVGWVRNMTVNDEAKQGVRLRPEATESPDRMASFQASFEAAVDHVREAKEILGEDARGATVRLRTSDPDMDPIKVDFDVIANPTKGKNRDILTDLLDQPVDRIVSVQIETSEPLSGKKQRKMQTFNARGLAARFAAAVRENPEERQQFAVPRGQESRLGVSMGRIGILGTLMGAASPGSQVAQLARYVGEYGPEAERLLGPHVKRVAYRYRGTESTPDRAITSQLHGGLGSALDDMAAAIDRGETSVKDATKGLPTKGDADPLVASLRTRGKVNPDVSGDSLKLGVRSDVAALELLKTLPKDALTGVVARRSGLGLPSQGVIIDSDGDVVSQSVGFANDHYLPFNLGNLGRLRGGQYVRTRQQGGLTGEDIMTTVFSGARSATVASSSGVFRLEMAPDFRGARAMSDKAQSMYDRYLRILETIDDRNDPLYSKPLPPEEAEKIESEALRIHKNPNSEAYQAYVSEKTAEARRKQGQITTADRAAVEAEAKAEAAGDARLEEELVDQKMFELKRSKATTVNLNGDGYALALKTLQQQFPYFIRSVEFTPLKGSPKADREDPALAGLETVGDQGFLRRMGASLSTARASSGRDAGYVKPGQEPWRTRRVAPAEEKPAEAKAKTEPAGRPGPGGVEGASPKRPTTASSTSTSTSSPAAQVAAENAKTRSERRRKVFDELMGPIARLVNAQDADENRGKGAFGLPTGTDLDMTSPEVQALSKPDQITWLLGAANKSFINEQFANHPQEVFRALTATDDEWRQALDALLSDKGMQSVLEDNAPFGAKNADELVAAVKSRAVAVLDTYLPDQPFAEASPGAELTTVGQALDYPEYTAAGTREEAQKLLDSDEVKPLAPLVAELAVDADGHVRSFAETGERLMRRVELLGKLEDLRTQVDSSPTLAKKDPDDLMDDRGISSGEVSALLGVSDDDTLRNWLGLEGAPNPDPDAIRSQAERWQRARTVAEVARVNDLMKVGGAAPKAWSALLSSWVKRQRPDHQPLAKAASRLRVESPDSPLARAVQLRKALGLPLVPSRRRSA